MMLDLKSGFWQIKVEASSCQKTVFGTHHSLCEFCVMPFGVKNVPTIIQHLMQNVLRELKSANEIKYVDVYLDDIIIFVKP